MSHSYDAIMLRCMDGGIKAATDDFLLKRGFKLADEPGRAGGIRDLVRPVDPSFAACYWRDIDLSVKAHKVPLVIIAHHVRCGAYSDMSFGSAQEEEDFHVGEMRKAKGMILQRHPHLKVTMIFVTQLPAEASDWKIIQ